MEAFHAIRDRANNAHSRGQRVVKALLLPDPKVDMRGIEGLYIAKYTISCRPFLQHGMDTKDSCNVVKRVVLHDKDDRSAWRHGKLTHVYAIMDASIGTQGRN